MAYVIAEPCIDVLDISCVSVCPVDCIHYDEGTDRKLFIDPNECIDCGACEPECLVHRQVRGARRGRRDQAAIGVIPARAVAGRRG